MAERSPISPARVLLIVAPVAIFGLAVLVWSKTQESAEQTRLSENVFARILSTNAVAAGEPMRFPDEDGDLVADSPDDPADCIDPQPLVLSFVAGDPDPVTEDDLKELSQSLSQATGREVAFIQYDAVKEQLDALANGELHIAVLNTGIVPVAVQQSGFVPLVTFGREDGSYGHTMRLIVPADSPIRELHDVRGRKLMFTRADSNSGCKAMLVVLREKAGLQPDRDYEWGFSMSHEESISGVVTGKYEAAPVASDILDRMIEKGEVDDEAIRIVYESERFPPATIGYVYNLTPELRTAIHETLIGFDLRGTGLEGEYGADVVKLVEVNYKDDWANIRNIEQLAAQARTAR